MQFLVEVIVCATKASIPLVTACHAFRGRGIHLPEMLRCLRERHTQPSFYTVHQSVPCWAWYGTDWYRTCAPIPRDCQAGIE